MKKKTQMVWNVYVHDFNTKDIKIYNVFNHGRFYEDVKKLLKTKDITREEFKEVLRRDTMYYFWSKCEYEIIITSFPAHITEGELNRLYHEEKMYRHMPKLDVGIKIDVYDQLRLNWERFVEYVWSFRKF